LLFRAQHANAFKSLDQFNGDFTVKKTPQEVYDFLVVRTGFARCCRIIKAWKSWTQEFSGKA